jgi:osmoprotectant transport system permease protein
MIAEITHYMAERHGVTVLGSLGFENAYALAMRRERARELGISTIEELAQHAPRLTFGTDLEFLSRPEWTALRQAYGIEFAIQRSFSPTFMYRAIVDGSVDVITAFSSDGRIAAQELVVLGDPKGAIPSYDALVLISPKRAKDTRLARALAPLLGKISVEQMREANLMVDRDVEKTSPKEAARLLAKGLGNGN